jgi:hypothetical protein
MMITCRQCSAVNSERRKFCGECGSLLVGFCGKCGFGNLDADKYCGGCGVILTAQAGAADEETRRERTAGGYSAAEIRELTEFRSEVNKSKEKKKAGADEKQMSQDAVSELFNSKNEE